ncbi:MAG TPA: DMT family transporter [Candidatus Limnocylindria bacterium]|nr:DMT family transporter [Candidatus Limnocylindria bacterium]
MFLIVMLYALWALSVTTSKELLAYTTPVYLTGMRMFLAGIILLAYQYFYAHEHLRFQKKDIWLYLQTIFFGIYLTNILRFWALGSITAAKSMFLFNFSPFMSSLYSYFVFKEKMTRGQWFGLWLGVVGMIPILMSTSPSEQSIGEFFFFSWPEIATLISVASQSYSWIVMRSLVRDRDYSPLMINGMSMFVGGFLALITAFFVEGFFPVTDVLPFFGMLMFVIVISNIICHNLYGYLLRDYTATFMSFAGFMAPIFAAGLGWGLKGEVITWHFYLSTVIVFIALYIFYKDELKQGGIEVDA